MKSIIICEGETDFVFLQHFMKKVNGWTDSKQKPNPSFTSSVNNSFSRDFIRNSDMLTIISCGGCGNIKTVFEEVIRKNQNEIFDEERYSKIVILTDNDEEGVEAKIVSELNAASGVHPFELPLGILVESFLRILYLSLTSLKRFVMSSKIIL